MTAAQDSIDLDFDEEYDIEPGATAVVNRSLSSDHEPASSKGYDGGHRALAKSLHRSPSYEERRRYSLSRSPSPGRSEKDGPEIGYEGINPRRTLAARRFGIDPQPEELSITKDELYDLYKSMGTDPYDQNVRFHSVLVYGIKGLTAFHVQKMFAEFSPVAVDVVDDESCNVIWNERYTVGKMMLEMTKPLKRVRGHRETEEGEVDDNSSDEEDGEMKEEQGDDVVINIKANDVGPKIKHTASNYVEVDVDQMHIPPGRWRVLTKHVAQNQFIILRFSLREDLRKGRIGLPRITASTESTESTDKDGFSYKWTNKRDRVRPGLNIFDGKGNELEWDYEHDTRFYVDPERPASSSANPEAATPSANEPAGIVLGKRKIKSRGRGSKKAKNLDELLSDGGSMVADREEQERRTAALNHEVSLHVATEENQDSDISDDLDPSPTPQPWNYKKVQRRFEIPGSLPDREELRRRFAKRL